MLDAHDCMTSWCADVLLLLWGERGRLQVTHYTDLSGDEALELGEYETFTDMAKASNFGSSQLKDSPIGLNLDHADGETVPAFRPKAGEAARQP